MTESHQNTRKNRWPAYDDLNDMYTEVKIMIAGIQEKSELKQPHPSQENLPLSNDRLSTC
jgi:hypothetical protein